MAFPSWTGLWDDRHQTMMGPLGQRIANQDFGVGLRPPGGRTIYQQQSSYYNQQTTSSGGVGSVRNETTMLGSKFRVFVDVRQFGAQELEVKTTEGYVVVRGKHEEREDEEGLVAREFTRRYPLPKDVDPETVTSSLTTDKVLVIEARKKSPSKHL